MALYRVICAFGQHSVVTVLTRCGLPLPRYILADEQHSRCLTERVYLPTIVSGRVIWHLGYSGPKALRRSPRLMASFTALPLRKTRRIRSKALSPMALTAPSVVCGRCFQGCAWALAYATRSTNSLTS